MPLFLCRASAVMCRSLTRRATGSPVGPHAPPPLEPLGAHVAHFPSDGSLTYSTARSASAMWLSRPSQRSIVTACKLAGSLNDPLHRRLRQSRHLLRRYNCYRLERPLPGGDCLPLRNRAFTRRTMPSHYPGGTTE